MGNNMHKFYPKKVDARSPFSQLSGLFEVSAGPLKICHQLIVYRQR
jgi:hypothetical protein